MAPARDQARRPVWKNPFRPILIAQSKSAAQLDRIYSEEIQHIIVQDSELLDDIIHSDRYFGQPKIFPQAGIGDG
jgi:hypothetical protein